MPAKTKSPKTKFIKVPAPANYNGPAVWVNPTFFVSHVSYEGEKNIQTVALLPASLRTPSLSRKNPALVQLNIVIAKPESNETFPSKDAGSRQTGVLYVNPLAIAVLTGNPNSPKATDLRFIADDADIFAKKLFTVEGTPQQVAKKLGIDIS